MNMYIEELLDHYKNPRNYGEIENPDIKIFDTNPLCGDEIEIQVELDNNKIKTMKFNGKGCAISLASASMMTEDFKGKTVEEVIKTPNEVILERLGVTISPMRLKCALLAITTLQKGIIKHKSKEGKNATRIEN